MCRCSNKKQMRDCRKDRGNWFLKQKANQSLEYQRENMVSEVTSKVRRRDGQLDELR